ncbi:MAG TPA: hypothetical protein VMS09_18245 [Paenibacillus sp.]|nr:hypothetical protein [Paenibacillus sp.]HUC93926.1 hypothetical protein [Paenibacillus sp.]
MNGDVRRKAKAKDKPATAGGGRRRRLMRSLRRMLRQAHPAFFSY